MKIKPDEVIKKMLGEDIFEKIEKSDVLKARMQVVTDTGELETGLKIVPRTVMSFLIAHLSGMQYEENKEIHLPFASNHFLHIAKKDQDMFSGYIYTNGKKINEFENRSIPGVGIILMTLFELYNIEEIKEVKEKEKEVFDVSKLQDIIDERLRLHSLVSKVVDHKLAQRDAIEILIKEKLSQALSEEKEKEEEKDKAVKLREFLKQRQQKREELEFEKSESINCPDCGSNLYSGGNNMSLCICYGEDWNKKIKINKSEKKLKAKLPKSIDKENVEMLIQTLKYINKD